MSASQELLNSHLAAAKIQWNDAFAAIRKELNNTDPKVRELARRLMTLDSHTRYAVFGGDPYARLGGYERNLSSDPCSVMATVAQFLSYDIRDDGSPGVGYMRYDQYDGFVLCAKDHEDARPFFHNNIDTLRDTYPDAAYLDEDRALEVLDWYAARRRSRILSIVDSIRNDGLFDEEDLSVYAQTPGELQMEKLTDELTEVL